MSTVKSVLLLAVVLTTLLHVLIPSISNNLATFSINLPPSISYHKLQGKASIRVQKVL